MGNPIPVYLRNPCDRSWVRGGKILPFLVHVPQVGWGRGSVCRARRLLPVITEDIPVVQEEHTPEACHLVTLISAASALTGSA